MSSKKQSLLEDKQIASCVWLVAFQIWVPKAKAKEKYGGSQHCSQAVGEKMKTLFRYQKDRMGDLLME